MADGGDREAHALPTGPAPRTVGSQRQPAGSHPQAAAFPYDIVLSDVDGTLLRPTHALSARTIAAARALHEAGVPFALATGRMPSGLAELTAELGVPCWRICYSGAFVTDDAGTPIVSETIPLEEAREVIAVLRAQWPHLAPSYFAGPHWYAHDPGAPGIVRESSIVRAIPEQASFEDLLEAGIAPNKLFCNCWGDTGRSEEIRRTLAARFPQLTIIRSTSGALVEIVRSDVSKATGAAALLAHLGLSMERALAFGDDENDVPLLGAVGHGVAMGNAAPRVRRIAREVAPSNAEDGLAQVLEGLLAASRP